MTPNSTEALRAAERSELRTATKRVYWIVRAESDRLREDGCHIDAEINDECWELIVAALDERDSLNAQHEDCLKVLAETQDELSSLRSKHQEAVEELKLIIEAAEMAQTRLNNWADKCHNSEAGEVDQSARDWKRKIWGSFAEFDDLRRAQAVKEDG